MKYTMNKSYNTQVIESIEHKPWYWIIKRIFLEFSDLMWKGFIIFALSYNTVSLLLINILSNVVENF